MTDLSDKTQLDRLISDRWRQGESAGQISAHLYNLGLRMTRNSVIGRIYRMQQRGVLEKKRPMVYLKQISPSKGLPTPKVTPKTSFNVDSIIAKKKFIPDRVIKSDMIDAKKSKHHESRLVNPDTGEGVTIDLLEGCKWVMDFQRNGMPVYCNDPIHHRSFCEAHYHICYQPAPPKKIKMKSLGYTPRS